MTLGLWGPRRGWILAAAIMLRFMLQELSTASSVVSKPCWMSRHGNRQDTWVCSDPSRNTSLALF